MNAVLTESVPFASYRAAEFVFDELRAPDGSLRPYWDRVGQAFMRETPANLARRLRSAERILHENGTTYNVFGDRQQQDRPWEVDLVPLVLPHDEWQRVSAGISQRATLLSLIVTDLYGSRSLLNEGWLPPEILFAHPHYHRPFHDLPFKTPHRIVLCGTELARSPDGSWWVMADRTEAPAGAGYALENRIVLSNTWPQLIQECRVHRLAPFFMRLQRTLAELSPRPTENPRIVLLTPGPANPFYFEDVYLARYLGYMLVEGSDLAVRSDRVFIKTLDGLLPVDVIFSRIHEAELDPLELSGSALPGTPGLLHAVRSGNVALANAPGCGFLESPVLMAFLPSLCRHLLNEELRIPSIATWWCGGHAERRYVIEHLRDLVIKPAFEPSGSQEIYGNELTGEQLQELADRIERRPHEYVAQEWVSRSSVPVWRDAQFQAGHLALRTFAVSSGERYEVMPGALVRVASSNGPMQLSISAGDGSKDVWVLSSGPVEKISLLPAPDSVPELRRSSAQLPSRAADNLYWLGRHLDRAEMSARLLRTIIGQVSGESESKDLPELPALLRVLSNEIPPEAAEAGEGRVTSLPDLDGVLAAAMFQFSDPRSVWSVISEIVRIGSIVRDRLSHDTWRAINRIDEHYSPRMHSVRIPADEALNLLNQLIIDVAVCSGLIGDGMVRGPAWRFLDIGRRIERALLTCRLIGGALAGEPEPLAPVLSALLNVMDSQMTYRSRYLAVVRMVPVLDLLIADETNPRSLAFQIVALNSHLEAMQRDRNPVGLNEEQKCIAAALHDLRMLDLRSVMDGAQKGKRQFLDALFSRQRSAIMTLSDLLSRKYLVHSGVPHPLHEVNLEDS